MTYVKWTTSGFGGPGLSTGQNLALMNFHNPVKTSPSHLAIFQFVDNHAGSFKTNSRRLPIGCLPRPRALAHPFVWVSKSEVDIKSKPRAVRPFASDEAMKLYQVQALTLRQWRQPTRKERIRNQEGFMPRFFWKYNR